jgi:hypothetical protein
MRQAAPSKSSNWPDRTHQRKSINPPPASISVRGSSQNNALVVWRLHATPYEGVGPRQHEPKGYGAELGREASATGQAIAPSPVLFHRLIVGGNPAAAIAQPHGTASAAIPLTAEAIVAEWALRKAAVALTG